MRPTPVRAAALLGAALPLCAQEPTAVDAYPLRNVVVGTRNVFTEPDADGNLLYLIANFLHFPTDPEVVRRELWFGAGDEVTAADIEELERNLRATGLFGEVSVEPLPADPGAELYDLHIDSRDRFSLIANGTVSFVGGVGKFNASIGESNLFGTGKRVSFVYQDADDETSAAVRFTDPQLFGSWHRLSVSAGETEEGPFGSIDLRRPFKHLTDPLSYGVSFAGIERDTDYFARGNTVAEVPEERLDFGAFISRAWGPRDLRRSVGIDLRLRTSDFDPARGPDAARIRVPGDTVEIQLGTTAGFSWVDSYHEVTGLDALDYVEDLELGVRGSVRPALVLRDEDGRGDEVQGLLGVSLRTASMPLPETFVTTDVGGTFRWSAGETRGWRLGAALHAYQTSLPAQTLAGSLTFDGAFETQDLPPQFTLGEDNGLRGYPAREFSGTRMVRLNLEDRIRTGIDVWSFELGMAGFFDAGWVHDPGQGLSMGDAIRSAGVGLRVGSSHFLGRGIFRIDVAWPLDVVGGQEFDVSLSFASGQVFTFFGNATELRSEF